MRIISKFHDYYDGGQAWGMDRSILYLRETQVIEPQSKNCPYDKINPFYVDFCGKSYAGVFYRYRDEYYNELRKFFYSHEPVKEFIENNPKLETNHWYYSRYNKNYFKSLTPASKIGNFIG